jgi:hypothetical protein
VSRNQRLGLLALVVVVAVGAFLIAKPGSDDNKQSATTSSSATQTTTTSEKAKPPAAQGVVIRDNKPVGGVRSLKFTKGSRVRFEVSADSPQTLHLHGYDIEKDAKPGKPAVFIFTAKNEGLFELESHTAEHEGLEPVMARIVIEPS